MLALPRVRFKRLYPPARLPERAYNSAGFDLYSAEWAWVRPGQTKLVGLGLAAEFSPGFVALVWDRSGMGVRGMHRFGGVIDSDYRGEWKVTLHNANPRAPWWRRLWAKVRGLEEPGTLVVKSGDRVAQVIFQQYEQPECVWVDNLGPSARGDKGHGSSGGDPTCALDHSADPG